MCDEGQRERLLSRVRCYYEILKTSTFGKHIVNRLEKLLSAGMRIQVNSLPPVLPAQAAPAPAMAAVPPYQQQPGQQGGGSQQQQQGEQQQCGGGGGHANSGNVQAQA